jgi:hypothetical protein
MWKLLLTGINVLQEKVETEEIKPPTNPDVESVICYKRNLEKQNKAFRNKIIIIVLTSTTAHFRRRRSSEASAIRHSLQRSSNFSHPTSWHSPKRSGS